MGQHQEQAPSSFLYLHEKSWRSSPISVYEWWRSFMAEASSEPVLLVCEGRWPTQQPFWWQPSRWQKDTRNPRITQWLKVRSLHIPGSADQQKRWFIHQHHGELLSAHRYEACVRSPTLLQERWQINLHRPGSPLCSQATSQPEWLVPEWMEQDQEQVPSQVLYLHQESRRQPSLALYHWWRSLLEDSCPEQHYHVCEGLWRWRSQWW